MKEANQFNLNKLFDGSLRRLQTEAEYFSRLTKHNPELGRLNESHLVKLLRDYLPPKVGVGTGFIVSGGEHPRQSPQCDIVFYDALNNAPLYKSEMWSIFPIEIVYGVLEVKTVLNRQTLAEAFQKCAAIRAMTHTREGKKTKCTFGSCPFRKGNQLDISSIVPICPQDFLCLVTAAGKMHRCWRKTSDRLATR